MKTAERHHFPPVGKTFSDFLSDLLTRLKQLQSRFTWDLQEENLDLESLSIRLQDHIELQLGQRGAAARSFSFLAYVRYLQGQPEEALSLLTQSEQTTKECYGEENERRLIVTYGDLAWLKYHTGDYQQSQSYWQKVQDILVCTQLGPEHPDPKDIAGPAAHRGLDSTRPQKVPEVSKTTSSLESLDLLDLVCFCFWVWSSSWKENYPVVKHPAGSSTGHHPEVFGEKAWTYLKFSRSYYPKAMKCFRKALELQAEDSEWNAGYAICLFRTEMTSEDAEQSSAIRQLRRALEITPDDGVLLSMLALKLSTYNCHQEAEDAVERALKIDPENPHVIRYIGKYLRNRGKTDSSIDLLKRALERTSQSAFIHHQLAMCYNIKKKSALQTRPYKKTEIDGEVQQWRRQCIDHLEKAISIKPSFDLARADLALMYGEEKNFTRAEELFQRGLQRLPEISEKGIRQVYHQRYGDYHYYHTKTEVKAITSYKEGLLLTPNTWEWNQCVKKLKQIAERRLREDEDDSQAYALLAQVAQAKGDKKKAAEFYESALDCDGNNSEFLSALCDLRLELNKQHLQVRCDLFPSNTPFCVSCSDAEDLHCRLEQLQSRFTWDLKNNDLELDDLNKQLLHDMELQLGQRGAMTHSYRNLAYVRYLQGQPEEALSLLIQSEQKTKECYGENERRLIVMYGDLAWLKYHTGDHQQSQSYWQKVQDILVEHPTQSPTVLHPEVYGEKAWTFLKLSKSYYDRAEECFCRALELQPEDCEFNNGYAIVLYRTEQHVLGPHAEASPAIKQLRRALEINPDDAVLLSMLALKLLYYQKHEEADRLVERALEIGPEDTQVIRYVAVYLRKKDQLDECIDLLKKVLANGSQSAFIHHQLALCYLRKKKDLLHNWSQGRRLERDVQQWRRLTIQHLEEAVLLKDSMSQAKAELALQHAEDYNMTRAHQLFDDVLEKMKEEFWSVHQVICRCYAEFCCYHTKQKDLAIIYYKKALEFSVDSSEKRHCIKKLKTMAERRLDRNPRDATAHGILGAVARAEGDWERAVECYQKALEEDGDNVEFLSALSHLQQL
ncbi:uncharacterized protein LOC121632924 [Melanotaenia boesemani]|uniref:uncharacterized protein LOC121632924 n=1 Tax=Melanotaenia boesemani TaxID=1250792 RepID=UPI001C045B6A|nr:uncharacterized protein LOC121632924 [Melanotaenia boesemani]